MPERIAGLLRVVRILLGYGRHLADTVVQRAAAPSFTSIAACFGTINLSVILAHLHRGLLRAAALERLLLARAASGRDIAFARARPRDSQPTPAPATRDALPRSSRRMSWDDLPEFDNPTQQQIERQVRRRPVGRTIVDICLDLAVMPGLCTGPFWNELFEIMQWYGGSVAALMRERCRREEAFAREQDRSRTQGWDWWRGRGDMIRQALGFLIGEEPVAPPAQPATLAPAAALATGPP
jgi:hypothetical protein